MAKRAPDTRTPGERMKAWRSELNLTQGEAAEKAGITQNTWSEYERDIPQNASVTIVSKIHTTTGIEMEAWVR